jgi:hypothetical protein
MAMGKRRRRAKQTSMWIATQDLPRSAAHSFYTRLTQILDKADFDEYVEAICSVLRFVRDVLRPPRNLQGASDLANPLALRL